MSTYTRREDEISKEMFPRLSPHDQHLQNNIYMLKRSYAYAYMREHLARMRETKARTSSENVTSWLNVVELNWYERF